VSEQSSDSPEAGGRILIQAIDPVTGRECEVEISHRR